MAAGCSWLSVVTILKMLSQDYDKYGKYVTLTPTKFKYLRIIKLLYTFSHLLIVDKIPGSCGIVWDCSGKMDFIEDGARTFYQFFEDFSIYFFSQPSATVYS